MSHPIRENDGTPPPGKKRALPIVIDDRDMKALAQLMNGRPCRNCED